MASPRSCLVVALGLVLLAPAVSMAGLDKKGTADAKKATLLYKQGNYEEAATLFLQLSLDHQDMPVFVRNLGACYYYLHRPEPALSNLREYLLKKKDIEPQDREEVEKWIGEMEALTAQRRAVTAPATVPAPAAVASGTTAAPAAAPAPTYGAQQPQQMPQQQPQQPYQQPQQPYQQPQQPYQQPQQPYYQQPYQQPQQPYYQQPYYQQASAQPPPYAGPQPTAYGAQPARKPAPYTQGFLIMPFAGIHIPMGRNGEDFGPGFRMGAFFGGHLGPSISINGEVTLDVQNLKADTGSADVLAMSMDFLFSPLVHAKVGPFEAFAGPSLGFFGYALIATKGGETAQESAGGVSYGLNVGAGIPFERMVVGGLFSYTGRHVSQYCLKEPGESEHCQDKDPWGNNDPQLVALSAFAMF